MNWYKKNLSWTAISVVLLVISLMGLVTSCEFSLILEVENQTDQILTMGIDGQYYFDVLPHTTTRGKTTLMNSLTFFVEGVRKDGEIVFSKYCSHEELNDTTLKVVIPFKEENPYLRLQIENKNTDTIAVYINGAFIGWVQPGATLNKRPLPNDITAYPVEIFVDPVTSEDGITKTGPAIKIIDRTYNRDELEKNNWKIVVSKY